ncbi:MAG: hypothetical protein LBF81_03975 [Prevotellaceae bacterium]|nr:hypothetical protein [Prevotellaceae bacterium]
MLHLPYLSSLDLPALLASPSPSLPGLPELPVACANWKEYPYTPRVTVQIACTPSHLLLHYDVREKSIRAKYTQPNQPVYTDSCVEFFVSPDDRQTYYNFEFNCIGTSLMRHNVRPHEGLRATPELLATILTRSSLGNRHFERMEGDFAWQLTVAIPYTCFFAHPRRDWRGQTLWANCYKCGDELSEPHYLSLFPIHSPKPNFHLPQFFQKLVVSHKS